MTTVQTLFALLQEQIEKCFNILLEMFPSDKISSAHMSVQTGSVRGLRLMRVEEGRNLVQIPAIRRGNSKVHLLQILRRFEGKFILSCPV